jgi:hypothetical protein
MARSPICPLDRPLGIVFGTLAGGTQRRRRGTLVRAATRGLTLALLLALLLAGCSIGGTTRPGGYTCVGPPSPYGCWTLLSITPTHLNPDGNVDIPGDPVRVNSDVLVAPLACDAACQASSGGGGTTAGYIANVMELLQQSNNWFIRVGYETTAGGTQYFLQYYLPDVSPPNINTYLAATQIEPGFTGSEPFSALDIGKSYLSPPPASPEWVATVMPGYPPSAFQLSHTIGTSAFQPDHMYYGQVVYGTSEATALIAVFTNNFIGTGTSSQYLLEDGTPPGTVRTADHPTDAGWLIHPSTSATSHGGEFYVSCCQP